MNDVPIVILTALNLEYDAVRAKLTDIQVKPHPAGTRFEVGRLGDRGSLAALALVGKGNHPAAVLAERAIAEFSPAAVIVVRGISDRADGSKVATDGARWQQRAAANAAAFAAAFAVALAEQLALRPLNPRPGRTREIDRSVDMGSANTNIVSGNARVAVQAGQIFGGVRIGSEPELPADLATQIAGFREQLRQARQTGHIDGAVHDAAETELDIVSDALAAGTEQNRTMLMVALKRLRGLISDVADLTAKLAVIISTARSML
jgi:adenosylhomocysteine nucleosidase